LKKEISQPYRLALAHKSLLGTSIGDAFGDSFFGDTLQVTENIEKRTLPDSLWEFTDDTIMSVAVFEQLEKYGDIRQGELISQFIINLKLDEHRGYGATVRRLLRETDEGGDWKQIAAQAFDGMGSMGNGAAMRVSTIGAYWFDDLPKVRELARLSAEVTHTNTEAITGAMAVALATAIATRSAVNGTPFSASDFTEEIVSHLPDSDTRAKIAKGMTLSPNSHPESLSTILGNGSKMLAQDTVPFVIWCAGHLSHSFEEALWKAVSILGDRDTICAMVGGITIMSAHKETIPSAWQSKVENYETSIFRHA